MRSARRSLLAAALASVALLVAVGCGTSGRDLREPVPGAVSPTRSTSSTVAGAGLPQLAPLSLTSPAFASGQPIPAEYSCTGPSPALAWSGVPTGTAELALVVLDATDDNFVQWAVVGIPPTDATLSVGQVPPGAVQLNNSTGKVGWLAPCPAKGSLHTYNFMLLALPEASGLGPATAPKDAVARLQSLAKGNLVILSGTFEQGGVTSGTGRTGGTGPTGSGAPGTTSPKVR